MVPISRNSYTFDIAGPLKNKTVPELSARRLLITIDKDLKLFFSTKEDTNKDKIRGLS